jgi:hypothetical protein
MEFWIRSLADALAQRETNVGLVSSSLVTAEPRLERVFRTASIKSFEYCYAVSIKAIERIVADRTGQPGAVPDLELIATT